MVKKQSVESAAKICLLRFEANLKVNCFVGLDDFNYFKVFTLHDDDDHECIVVLTALYYSEA